MPFTIIIAITALVLFGDFIGRNIAESLGHKTSDDPSDALWGEAPGKGWRGEANDGPDASGTEHGTQQNKPPRTSSGSGI